MQNLCIFCIKSCLSSFFNFINKYILNDSLYRSGNRNCPLSASLSFPGILLLHYPSSILQRSLRMPPNLNNPHNPHNTNNLHSSRNYHRSQLLSSPRELCPMALLLCESKQSQGMKTPFQAYLMRMRDSRLPPRMLRLRSSERQL